MERPAAQYEFVDIHGSVPVWFEIIRKCGYMSLHWHEYIEIVYQLQGSMVAVVQGRTYELQPGDLLIANENELHRTRSLGSHTPYILLQIPIQYLHQIMPTFEVVRFQNYISSAELDRCPELRNSFAKMRTAYESQENGWPLHFMEGLYGMLYMLYRHFAHQVKPDTIHSNISDLKRVSDVMSWVQENYQKRLTLIDAANFLGVSKEHFCRLFRKYTAQTFIEYLYCYRAVRFWEDMQSNDESMSVLMEKHGISNYKVFSRVFKDMYGKTPRELRGSRNSDEARASRRKFTKRNNSAD